MSLKLSGWAELMRDMNDWRESVRELKASLAPVDVARTVASGGVDRIREVVFLAAENWGIYETAFFANERGVLGENEWHRFERLICIGRDSARESRYRNKSIAGVAPLTVLLTPEFVEYVESCE